MGLPEITRGRQITNSTTWHKTPPATPGLYIASTARCAGWIRYWTGVHWTPPLSVADLHLTDRIPHAGGGKAITFRRRPIEWLEAVTLDGRGHTVCLA